MGDLGVQKLAAVAVLLLLLPAALAGQATAGSAAVSGQVRDSSDAVLPGARVVLTEQARSLDRETLSNEAGNFLFPSVPAGLYSLRVTKENFDAGVRPRMGNQARRDSQ